MEAKKRAERVFFILWFLFHRVEEESFFNLSNRTFPNGLFRFFFLTECHSRFRANLSSSCWQGVGGGEIQRRVALYLNMRAYCPLVNHIFSSKDATDGCVIAGPIRRWKSLHGLSSYFKG